MPKARRNPYVQSTHSCPKNEWNELLADNHCEAVILFLESSIRKNHYVKNTQGRTKKQGKSRRWLEYVYCEVTK